MNATININGTNIGKVTVMKGYDTNDNLKWKHYKKTTWLERGNRNGEKDS